ncbi:hypothetical protein BDR26DRAFT_318684 [Obelidium mucronatum]|nr:hypothetical protein BDR26DRAFT_318684 [Obelidium mucronatum]
MIKAHQFSVIFPAINASTIACLGALWWRHGCRCIQSSRRWNGLRRPNQKICSNPNSCLSLTTESATILSVWSQLIQLWPFSLLDVTL